MAEDFTKVELTNTDGGMRGIHAKTGLTYLAPGETREVELSKAERDDLPEHFSTKGMPKAAKPNADPFDGMSSAQIQAIADAAKAKEEAAAAPAPEPAPTAPKADEKPASEKK